MLNCILVGTGGFIGSVLRYLISLIPLNESSNFPYKTLIINVVGSFMIAFFSALALKNRIDPKLSLMLRTGLCGGFTTFSTFAYETSGLFKSGFGFSAVLYVIFSVFLGIFAVFAAEYIFLK